jgi:hypothetical protein
MATRTFTVTVTKTFGNSVLVTPMGWSSYVTSSVSSKFSGSTKLISYAVLSGGPIMKAAQKVSSSNFQLKYGLVKAPTWGLVPSFFASSKPSVAAGVWTQAFVQTPKFFDIEAALKKMIQAKINGVIISGTFSAFSHKNDAEAGLNITVTNPNTKAAGGKDVKLYGTAVYQNGYTITVTKLTYSFWS